MKNYTFIVHRNPGYERGEPVVTPANPRLNIPEHTVMRRDWQIKTIFVVRLSSRYAWKTARAQAIQMCLKYDLRQYHADPGSFWQTRRPQRDWYSTASASTVGDPQLIRLPEPGNE